MHLSLARIGNSEWIPDQKTPGVRKWSSDPKYNTRDWNFGGREDNEGPVASQQMLFQKLLRKFGVAKDWAAYAMRGGRAG